MSDITKPVRYYTNTNPDDVTVSSDITIATGTFNGQMWTKDE